MEHAAVARGLGNPRRREFLRMRSRIARGGGGDEADAPPIDFPYLAQTSQAERANRRAGGAASGPGGGPSSVFRVEEATAETARRDSGARGPSAAAGPPALGIGSPRQPGAHRAFFAVGSGVAAAIFDGQALLQTTFAEGRAP